MTALDAADIVTELIAEAPDVPPPRKHLRDRLLTLQGLAQMPPVRPLVDGLLYRGTLAQLAGQPGSYKSFVTIGMAVSVALGRSWEGHAVPEAGPVVYVAAEGASGLRARILAFCDLSGIDPGELEGRLFVLPEPVQLGNTVDVSQAVEVAEELQAVLLVLDTRARCTLGLSENDATDQGKAIDSAEEIQRRSGCTVLGVHHSGRGGDHGRGSNAWDGAVWSDLRLKAEDTLRCTIRCEKHKDVPDDCEHHFRLVSHVVPETLMPGCDEQQRSTLVAVQAGHVDTLAGDRPSDRTVMDIVQTSAGEDGLTTPLIVQLAEDRNLKRAAVYRSVKALVERGALRNIGTDKRCRYVATPLGATREA
jgi:hypothetical protein